MSKILKEATVEKAELDADSLGLINKNTMRELKAEEVFTFKLAVCGNDVDRDFEAFPADALQKLAVLLDGKTVIQDHIPSSTKQIARIYRTEIESTAAKAKTGEQYSCLIAYCYMMRTDGNKDFISEIEAGIKKEVSVACEVSSVICSICGADNIKTRCPHRNGVVYDGQTCYKKLENPVDAYEVSFVAVPAQKEAGVTKDYGGKPADNEPKHITNAEKLKAAFRKNGGKE